MKMKTVTVHLPEFMHDFYIRIAEHAGVPVEQVISDALFRLAGMLAADIVAD